MTTETTRTALLLDGRRDNEPTLALAHDALVGGRPQVAGPSTTGACATTRSPGARVLQVLDADARRVRPPRRRAHRRRALVHSDLVVFLTPVTFGGYSSELKKALDHVIPILQPFMQKRGGETRHPQRYVRRRDLLVIGTSLSAGRRPRGDDVPPAGGARHPEHAAAALHGRRVEEGAGEWEVRVAVAGLLAESA